jgi:hypothetical protein
MDLCEIKSPLSPSRKPASAYNVHAPAAGRGGAAPPTKPATAMPIAAAVAPAVAAAAAGAGAADAAEAAGETSDALARCGRRVARRARRAHISCYPASILPPPHPPPSHYRLASPQRCRRWAPLDARRF